MYKLVLMGPPCSGKGSLGKLLSAHYSIPHISTGDHFRATVKKIKAEGADTDIERAIYDSMSRNELVADSIAVDLVNDVIARNSDSQRGYILDGFPRTVGQAESFYEKNGTLSVDAAIYLSADEDVLVQRMFGREDNRSDDNLEAFTKRLAIDRDMSAPVKDFYAAEDKLLAIHTNASGDFAIQLTYDQVCGYLTENFER